MIQTQAQEAGVRVLVRLRGKDRQIVVPEARVEQVRRIGKALWRAPFDPVTWRELSFFVVSSLLAIVGFAFTAATLVAGVVLFVTFIGAVILAASLRGTRGFGRFHRNLARGLLGEDIEEPAPFQPRPGFFGWLQSAFRDRVAWRTVAYAAVKMPLTAAGVYLAFSFWVDAFFCLGYPIFDRSPTPPEFGLFRNLFAPGFLSVQQSGFFHALFIVVTGVLLLFIAPWPTRLFVWADRHLMRALLSPDPTAARMRSLEQARAQSVDASAATLRKIERDLHDGTQAQLVALAMRLGQVKEKLAGPTVADLDHTRRLVDEAHRGAKEAIVDLRDLVRGIHPPVLDTGLEGALSTLAARSPLPTSLAVELRDRPTPAIEAIAYFCVAELLANVAQHAHASRASISCAQHGQWVRLVVRDDGIGGARAAVRGSSSSGLAGLLERVRTVDGGLSIMSPVGGPTAVTVDLPLHV